MGENFQTNQIITLPSACLPSLKYLQKCCDSKQFLIESKETYPKQTIRNRYLINGANSPLILTVPVRKPFGSKTKTEDIEIDCSENWRKVHFETLKTAYNNSPYFEHYLYDLHSFFDFKKSTLLEWNNRILTWLNEHLSLSLIFEINPEFSILELENNSSKFIINHTDLHSIETEKNLEGYWSFLHYLFEFGPMFRQKLL